jgi:GTPase SAR1 family protein
MLPLIYLVGAGIAGLFLSSKGFGLWGKDENGEPILEKKLAVLGPSNSGKTHLFNFLSTGKIEDFSNPTTTFGETVKRIEIKDGNKTLILKTTKDVPGSELSISNFYPKLIKESTDIFFIFNCKDFLEKESYRKHTLSLIDYINRHNNNKKLIIYLGSHVDELLKQQDSKRSRIDATNQITESLKTVLDLRHVNEIELINMKSEDEMNSLKKSLFK